MEDPKIREVIDEFEKQPRKLIDPCNIDTNSRKYWQQIFHAMDEYSSMPYHKRESILEKTLNDPLLISRLANIYDIHHHEDIIDFNQVSSDDTQIRPIEPKPIFQEYCEDYACTFSDIKFALSDKTLPFGAEPESRIMLERQPTIDYRKELTKYKDMSQYEGESMYAAFLKKSPEKASRWRPKPALTLDGMSLAAKCDAITREIAEDFVAWMESLGGETRSSLDVDGIEGLFEIGFNCHAADSLKINMKELNSVTEYVAHARGTPELSFATQLYRQLYRDKTAVKTNLHNFAFGTMLPPEMRVGSNVDSDVSKWLENKRVPEKLATMAVVWEDIESLKSTEGYCNFLLQHEEITPPSYLVNKGLLDVQKKAESPNLYPIGSNTVTQSKLSIYSASNISAI